MRTFLFLALPLASLAFLSGCCIDGDCPPVAAASAPIAAPAPKLAAAEVSTPAAPKAKTPAPKVAGKRAAPDGMIVIPTMPLPKGWRYIGEQDLES